MEHFLGLRVQHPLRRLGPGDEALADQHAGLEHEVSFRERGEGPPYLSAPAIGAPSRVQ